MRASSLFCADFGFSENEMNMLYLLAQREGDYQPREMIYWGLAEDEGLRNLVIHLTTVGAICRGG
jgi:hypothetical protein